MILCLLCFAFNPPLLILFERWFQTPKIKWRRRIVYCNQNIIRNNEFAKKLYDDSNVSLMRALTFALGIFSV